MICYLHAGHARYLHASRVVHVKVVATMDTISFIVVQRAMILGTWAIEQWTIFNYQKTFWIQKYFIRKFEILTPKSFYEPVFRSCEMFFFQ